VKAVRYNVPAWYVRVGAELTPTKLEAWNRSRNPTRFVNVVDAAAQREAGNLDDNMSETHTFSAREPILHIFDLILQSFNYRKQIHLLRACRDVAQNL
jgi:hypothetical protein